MKSRALKAVRDFFWERGYTEVDTPIAVKLPGQEPHLHPVCVYLTDDRGAKHQHFLHTSPEYSMKKLLGAGFKKIFQITHAFRGKESFGGLHQPEFTMLEWYRCGAGLENLMDETEELIKKTGSACGAQTPQPKRATMKELFFEFLKIDLDKILSLDKISDAASRLGLKSDSKDRYEDCFFKIFLNHIEPRLPKGAPLIIYRYPAALGALSQLDPSDTRYALRFELYMNGVEIANAFQELLDPVEQRARFIEEQKIRQDKGEAAFPIDEELLKALDKIERPTAGIALGTDRLLMAMLKKEKIDDLIPFPFSNPPTKSGQV